MMKKKSEVSGAKVRPMVVVTGVSGLIGSALVDELARDYRMVGLDIKEPAASFGALHPPHKWRELELQAQEAHWSEAR